MIAVSFRNDRRAPGWPAPLKRLTPRGPIHCLDSVQAQDTDKARNGRNPKPSDKVDKHNLLPLGLIIVFGIFASTLPQPLVLGRLPLQFLLKNEVGVTLEQMAAFFFWCTLAWYLKPFAGILTDAFPIFSAERPELDWHGFSSPRIRAADCN
jgi:BT1 family